MYLLHCEVLKGLGLSRPVYSNAMTCSIAAPSVGALPSCERAEQELRERVREMGTGVRKYGSAWLLAT